MKNILIATDFTKEAYCALHYATQLFKENSKYFIVNFIGDKIKTTVYSALNDDEFSKVPGLRQESELKCTETLHEIVRDSGYSADRFETITSESKLVPGIEALIQTHEIDVVVMGTKKHSGLLDTLNTNTLKIINKALPVPVLIIPRELEFSIPKNIAFASELIYEFNFEALGLLKEIASSHNAKITVVHDGDETEVSQRQWKNYNAFRSFFKEIPVSLEFYASHLEVSRTIADFVKDHKMDMLCMGYYKHSPGGRLFREPIVLKIDKHLAFPFLILPENPA